MKKRKICVVTGSRADYGLLRRLLAEIEGDSSLSLQLVATGQHLCGEYGLTRSEIEADGFVIDDTVELLPSEPGPVGVAQAVGRGVIGFADVYRRLAPDIVVVLGDRYEIFAAAQCAMILRMPVAHIHGGEASEGAIDDSMRHAITKMSHLHFPAAESYRRRIVRMGEDPRRVFCHGAPGLDDVKTLKMLPRGALEKQLGITLGKPFFLVTYHPATASDNPPARGARSLFEALREFPDATVLLTGQNSDAGSEDVAREMTRFLAKNPGRAHVATSLGRARYLSAMRHADVVVGNSSSGIIEAPFLKKATVNIGDRQNGRLKATAVIDCAEDADEIAASIRKALSPAFQRSLQSVVSLYGAGDASRKIKNTLKVVKLEGLLQKRFHDLCE